MGGANAHFQSCLETHDLYRKKQTKISKQIMMLTTVYEALKNQSRALVHSNTALIMRNVGNDGEERTTMTSSNEKNVKETMSIP